MVEIVSIDGMMDDKILPKEYANGFPRLYMTCSGPYLHLDRYIGYSLAEGERYNEVQWEKTMEGVRNAGQRLHELRKKEKQLKETWKGEETYVI